MSVQHEVLPRVSVEVGYFRRWFQGFIVTDNLAVAPSDFEQFSVTAPLDSRLPGGGGYTVGPLYDVNPALFGVTNNYITSSDNYGDQYQRFNGLDFNVNARPRNGLTVQGGFSGGKSMSDNCEIRAKLPEIAPLNPFCHVETGYLPQYKLLGSYIVPKVDVQVERDVHQQAGHSGQRLRHAGRRGGALAANYTVANAVVAAVARPAARRATPPTSPST